MKKSFFLFMLLFAASVIAAPLYVSGTISSDSTWTVDNTGGGTVIIDGNLTIDNGAKLTIGPLVNVELAANTGIFVNGQLEAKHSQFISNETTPAAGDWRCVQIGSYYHSGQASFDTCTFRYGSRNSGEATVYVYSGSATLNSCEIQDSKYLAVRTNANQQVTLENSNITNSESGMTFYDNSNVLIKNTGITGCEWPLRYEGDANLVFSGVNSILSNTYNGILMNNSSIDNNMVLDTINVPYVFINTTTVQENKTLEIASGNILKFDRYDGLNVEGKLIAEAGVGENIYFTAYSNDNLAGDTNDDGAATTPSASYWGSVYFKSGSDSLSVMKRCILSYGGYYQIGALSMDNASPTIDSCQINNSYYGAMFKNASKPVFSNNEIGSSTKVPLALTFDSSPVFTNNSFSMSDNEYDAIGILGGTLTEDAVLPIRDVTDIPNVTYLLLGTVTVPESISLTINKGVVIKGYYYNHRIVIQGKLMAEGTADSMITFTSALDDTYGNPKDTNKDGTTAVPDVSDWSGITFEGSSDTSSVMNYCRVKYADMYSVYYHTRWIYDGAITLINASPTISNCEIKDVNYGIYAFQASNPKILNTDIINTAKTPVAMSVSADPTFSGNTFTNATWTAIGLIGESLGYGGTLSKRNVAGYDNISYLMLEDLTINSGTNVLVEPGVVIKMADNAAIFVEGGLKLDGTDTEKIIFTSVKDDNYGNPGDTNGDGQGTAGETGDWETVQFKGSSDDSYCIVDNCIFQFGGYYENGNITITDANTSVSNTSTTGSHYYGIKCDGGSMPNISNLTISNCRMSPIAMSLMSNPTFTDIVFSGNGSSGIRLLEGDLASDATLAQRDIAGINNIAYIVDYLTVKSNAVLTINPGVVLKVEEYYTHRITIEGALVAKGTSTDPIVITSIKDDSFGGDTNNDGSDTSPARGDWWSLIYQSSSADTLNVLKNCKVRYAGSGGYWYAGDYKNYGNVRIFDAYVNIDSSVIEQSNNAGIGIFGSANPDITNSNIVNIRYTPIAMSMFSEPVFANNTIANLGYTALGIVSENLSVSNTVPKRNFGGYENITYYMYKECSVNAGAEITIPAGVVFKSYSYDNFDINGTLNILGTESEPVVFTDYRDDEYGNPKDTNGDGFSTTPTINSNYQKLDFADVSNDTSLINHAIFRYTNHGINLQQASPLIQNCTFDKTNWGVRLNGVSAAAIDSCTFHNVTYSPIITSMVSYPSSTVNNLITGTTYKALGIIGETLVQEVTLPRRNFGGVTNIPYYFSADYTVGTSAGLTIEPGVVLKFKDYVQMFVENSLIAEGGSSPDSLIVFTSIKDDFYGGDTNGDSTATEAGTSYYDSWEGIHFKGESIDENCRLENCVVKYTRDYPDYYAGIMTTDASPTITHCLITKNGIGVLAKGSSNPVINFCDIYDNIDEGVKNVDGSFIIDATNNWWGKNTGPTHTDNPGGTGEEVSDNVDYTPFLQTNAQNPMVGDVSLNGYIQAYDGSLVLQEVVGLLTPALSAIQNQVADVSANDDVSAYDASLILQYVVGLINAFPAEINSKSVNTDTEEIQRTVQQLALYKSVQSGIEIGDSHAAIGEEVTVPVVLRNVSNLVAADLTFTYNSEYLEPVSVSFAKELSKYSPMYRLNPENSEIKIAIAGTEILEQGELKMAHVTFKVKDDVKGEQSGAIEVASFKANDTDLTQTSKPGTIKITGLPTVFALKHNYPNPFNAQTVIQYQVPDPAKVTIDIYNIRGQKVKTLVQDFRNPGTYQVHWNGTNDAGMNVASGTYFFRMSAGNFTKIRKMQLLK